MTSSKNRAILLMAILLLGLFFRLYDLGRESLWLDEAFSIKFAELNLSQIFFLPETNPPLYYIILHWWIHLFGISEISVRFPSAIFGFLSLFMMYKIGSELFDINVGKLSSLLMAFSLFHIQYSQEARTYSLSVLLTLLSMYFFIKLLKKVNHRFLIGYVLSSILLMYSHIYGLFIIIAQNIYFIVLSLLSKEAEKLNYKRWILIQSILIVLFAPWISIFINQVHAVQKDFWIKAPHIHSIISSFITYSSKSRLLLSLFLMLSLFSLISYEKLQGSMDRRYFFKSLESFHWKIHLLNTDKFHFLLLWLITPIILPFIISLFSQPIYMTRYTIVASSAFFLLIARGISNMHSKNVKSITISIIIILSLISIGGYYNKINKEQWRDVANCIDTYAHNEDMVLFNAYYCMQVFNYYSRSGLLVKKGFPEKDRNVDEENISELLGTVEHYDRVWVILAHSGDKKELITKTLIKSYNLSYYKEYKDIKLYLFDRKYVKTAPIISEYQP
ncbi:MAG: glycosyltransferase family 39 protein [Nitrospirae bacterium]|jgi:mannosyltransferase|nr:glycosyltransferase family 39 protein [Nitrospirota bacterium]